MYPFTLFFGLSLALLSGAEDGTPITRAPRAPQPTPPGFITWSPTITRTDPLPSSDFKPPSSSAIAAMPDRYCAYAWTEVLSIDSSIQIPYRDCMNLLFEFAAMSPAPKWTVQAGEGLKVAGWYDDCILMLGWWGSGRQGETAT
jgi:hypothetical protein